MLHCPNCSALVDSEPVRCEACGYRSEMAREYFWLYAGGAGIVVLGFILGIAGVAAEASPGGSWSRGTRGWFPLTPWPAGYHWLGHLVVGAVLTVAGLGLMHRLAWAWVTLAVVLLYEAILAALAALGSIGGPDASTAARILFPIECLVLAATARVGFAYLRTPPRRNSVSHEPAAQ